MKKILLYCLHILFIVLSLNANAQWQKVLGKNNIPYDASQVTQFRTDLYIKHNNSIFYSRDAGKQWKQLKLNINTYNSKDVVNIVNFIVNEHGIFAVITKKNLVNYRDSAYFLFTPNLGSTCEVKALNIDRTNFTNDLCWIYQTKDYVFFNVKGESITPPPVFFKIRKDTRAIEIKIFTGNPYSYFVSDIAEYILYSKNGNIYIDIIYHNGNKVTKLLPYNSSGYGSFLKDSLLYIGGSFSKDFGQSWYKTGNSLPVPEGITHGSREGYFFFTYNNKIYAITNAKIYSSSNDGLDWSLESTELQKYVGNFNPSLSVVDSILTFRACHPLDYCYEKFSYNILTKQITYLNTEIYPSGYIFSFDDIIKLPNGKLLKKNTPYLNFVSSDNGATWQNSIDYPYFFDRVQLNDSTFYAFDQYSQRDVNSFKIPIVRYVNNVRKDTVPDSNPLSILGHYNSRVFQKGDTIIGLTRTQDTLVYSIKPFINLTLIPLTQRVAFNLIFFENKKIYAFIKDIQHGTIFLSIIGLDGSIQKVESLDLKGTLQSISEPSNIWIANGTTAYNTKDLGLNTRSISTITSNSYYLTNELGTSVFAVIKKDNIPNEKVLVVLPYAVNTPYISVDSGKTWTFFNLGIEKEQVLRVQQVDNYLFATTQTALYRRSLEDILMRSASGTVFFDENGNTIFDRNERPVVNTKVYSPISNAFYYTDSLGRYTVLADVSGTDTIMASFENKYATISPNFYALSKSDTGKNFAIKLAANVNDLKGSITAITSPRPGFNNSYLLNYKNVGSTIADGKLSLQYNAKQTLVASTSSVNSNANQTLVWNYSNLQPNESRQLQVTFKTGLDVPVRSQISNILTIDPLSIDTFKADNIDTLIQTVVGSFDPNDKQVTFNNSKTPPSVIDPSTELIYTIRFQNTGNYPADFVTVTDTLSDKLDLTTFRLIATSHKGSVSVRNKNVLSFNFNPIYLPDSLRDEAGSHGFVKFAIKPKKTLTKDEAIKNTGYIFFDYNPAVITNTVETANQKINSIFTPSVSAGKLEISPNPAQQIIKIDIEDADFKQGTLSIYDLSGRLMFSKSISDKTGVVDVSHLSVGKYVCTIKSVDNKIFVNKFVKVQ